MRTPLLSSKFTICVCLFHFSVPQIKGYQDNGKIHGKNRLLCLRFQGKRKDEGQPLHGGIEIVQPGAGNGVIYGV